MSPRGYPDDRGPRRQPSRRDSYNLKDRSASPPRRPTPAPARLYTAQETKSTPQSPSAMLSPLTSPSEAGAEAGSRQAEKGSEEATDPRHRAKGETTTSIQSPQEMPRFPAASPSHANTSLAITTHNGTHITQVPSKDVDTVDYTLDAEFTQLAKSLSELSELKKRAVAQFGVFQRLEEQYAEKRRAMELAEEKFKEHSAYCGYATVQESFARAELEKFKDHSANCRYAILQERTARAELEKASKAKAELESGVKELAERFMGQLAATIQNLQDKKPAIPNTAIEILQADIDSLKAELRKQQPAASHEIKGLVNRNSEAIQYLRKEHERRITEAENTAKSIKPAVTAQVKLELGEARRQLQLKTNPLLNECRNLKQECEDIKQGTLEAMKNSESNKTKIDADLQHLRDENIALRKLHETFKAQMRDEFEKFKADLIRKQQRLPSEADKIDSRDAIELLEPYVNSYKQDIQMLTTQNEKLTSQVESTRVLIQSVSDRLDAVTPDVHKSKGAADFAHQRLDSFHQNFGALRDKVDRLEKRAPESQTASPFPTLVASHKQNEANAKRLTDAERKLDAVNHSIRTLNTRYNNITSEDLAQQIAGIINPINASALADIIITKQALSQLQQQQKELHGTSKRSRQRLDNVEAKAGAAAATIGGLARLETRVKSVESAIPGINNIQNIFSDHQKRHSTQLAAVNTAVNLQKEEIGKIKNDLIQQDSQHKSTCLKIDEHLNDELDTVKGDIAKGQKSFDHLKESVKGNSERFGGVRTALSKLESDHEKAAEAPAISVPDLREEFKDLKNDMRKEKDSIDERINLMVESVKGLERKVDSSRDISGRLSTAEKAIEALEGSIKDHSDKLEAMEGTVLSTFTANHQAIDGNMIVVKTPTVAPTTTPPPDTSSQGSANAGNNPTNDANDANDAKTFPQIPMGPRETLYTPRSSLHKPPTSLSTPATAPNKRRNNSPFVGSMTRKKPKWGPDWHARDSNPIDLTQDNETSMDHQ